MTVVALVRVSSGGRAFRHAAATQGTLPLLAVVAGVVALLA